MIKTVKTKKIFLTGLISLLVLSIIIGVKNSNKSYAAENTVKIKAKICSGGPKYPTAHIKTATKGKLKEIAFTLKWVQELTLQKNGQTFYQKTFPANQEAASFKKSFDLETKSSITMIIKGGCNCPNPKIVRKFNINFDNDNEYSSFVDLNEYCYDDLSPEITGKVYGTNKNLQININGKNYTAINNQDNTWTVPKGTIDKLNIADETITVKVNDLNNETTVLKKNICFTILDDFILPPNTGQGLN